MKPSDLQRIHVSRDDGGTWWWEMLPISPTGAAARYFRRRPGQSRIEVTWDEVHAAMSVNEPVLDYSKPEPAWTGPDPAFGPRRRA